MNTLQAARAAVAQIQRVDDADDLSLVRRDFDAMKRNWRFLDFRRHAGCGTKFESDVAQVVTRVGGKQSNAVRRLSRTPGRDTFDLPALQLQAAEDMSYLDPRKDPESYLPISIPSTTKMLGIELNANVESHMLLALLASAEDQGRVVRTSREDLLESVESVVGELDTPCSVVVSHTDSHLLHRAVWVIGRPHFGEHGWLVPTRGLGDGVVLVVANNPEEVGFLATAVEPQLFVGMRDLCNVRTAAIGSFGFCAWGDAPVVKIDMRPKA